MKNTTVAGLLRAALALWTAAVLTAAACFVPVFMRHICAVRPELAGRYGWGVAFGWLLAAMMLWAFLLLWRVMGTVAQGQAFVRKNATRFRRVWQLSAASFTLCAGTGYFHGPDQYPSALSGVDGRRPFAGHGHGRAGQFRPQRPVSKRRPAA